ncbi:RNA polymerase sigma factor for flagellar operon FliA [Geomicrobium halophilum]|uniref:RNA polymerase sigma factor for flagellar operon FliA n=1 Tax=Geomicrobium halophilum TaxID=549000 RepID=A0A841PXQ4_9BACL|nr:FliA/WhiG family RNA polymerase sigma factor [Geomicrobium halophilum]MBB6449283.1 RNA polymerase sigma factor for flagellar operon FliA [Geomicrobium halophilum]
MRTTASLGEIWARWINHRDRYAEEELMAAYSPLVDYHVQRISTALPRTVDRDELRSHGMIGLFDALHKFEHKRELKFDTYASFRVRGAIIDGLRKEDWLPRSIREKAKKIEETTEVLQQKKGRHVTEKEVAIELNISVEEVLKTTAESYMSHLLSIDGGPHDEDNEDSFLSAVQDRQAPLPHEEAEKKAVHKQLQTLITKLSEQERLVLSLFYYEELTLTEIGAALRLSTSRISQIHSKALFRLKQAFQKEMTR